MKLLADENTHSDIVAWLRQQGHDVLYAAEILRRRLDSELLSIAEAENRLLLTGDKDFGELVFHRRQATQGIVLLRLRLPIAESLERLSLVWPEIESQAAGKFVVVSEYRVRVRTASSEGD